MAPAPIDFVPCSECDEPTNLDCDVCGDDICDQCIDDHMEDYHGTGGDDL